MLKGEFTETSLSNQCNHSGILQKERISPNGCLLWPRNPTCKNQQTTCLHTAIQVSGRHSSSSASATLTPRFELKYSLKPPSHDAWMAPHEQNGVMSCHFGGIGHNLHPMGVILSLCEHLRTATGITKQPPSRSRWGFNFGWNYWFQTPQSDRVWPAVCCGGSSKLNG